MRMSLHVSGLDTMKDLDSFNYVLPFGCYYYCSLIQLLVFQTTSPLEFLIPSPLRVGMNIIWNNTMLEVH